MIKYLGCAVTFQEIPNETTLCINITNCSHDCAGCHSPELREDIGENLEPILCALIETYSCITCVCFFGEGNDWDAFDRCVDIVRSKYPGIKVAWYTGFDECSDEVYWYMSSGKFDYIKTGPYIESRGGLNNPLTNQKMYMIVGDNITDITYKFQKKGFHNNDQV